MNINNNMNMNNFGMNNNMNNMNNMNNFNNTNNLGNNNFQSPPEQQSATQSFLEVNFKYFGDRRFPEGVSFMVQGRGDMTIKELIKNFRIKLADDKIKIKSYLLDGKTKLDENSTRTVNQTGINKKSVITATKK